MTLFGFPIETKMDAVAELRLALLEIAIRNTESRGFYERVAAFVRLGIVFFLILLVVRCFGSWGGMTVDVIVAMLFVSAGFVSTTVDPVGRTARHAKTQKDAYDAIAQLVGIKIGNETELAKINGLLNSIRECEPPVRTPVRTRALRAARISLGVDPECLPQKITGSLS